MEVLHQVPAPANRSALRGKLTGRLLGWALALGALPAAAQHVPRTGQAMPEDTVRQIVDLPAATIDSLAAEPLTEPAVDSVRLAWLQTPATLQELVGDRMSCFETAAPHQFNNAVMAYVRLFTERQRGYTQRVLERRDFYFPLFEKYLAKYNLPDELKYLSVVESALIPTAKSQVGAVGLWQFMPPTAGDLRLKRDEWVDERMHPEKATEAACKYLRDLYHMFHDWELVLAAYNWGAGNVQRTIRKTGKRNFWEMYPHMPAETRNYVPTFTAIMYAMTYAKEHDLHNTALHYQHYEPLDTLGLRGQALDLRRLSHALGYADSLALLRYNPELRHPGLPAGYRPYVLRFPTTAREHLGDVDHATLLAYCQPTAELPQPLAGIAPRLSGVEPWPSAASLLAGNSQRPDTQEAAPRLRRLSHTLRRGQTLAAVAEKYDVSQTQLRKWNALRKGQALKPGKQLTVFVPAPMPAAPRPNRLLAAPTPPPATVATLRRTALVDTAWQALAAANTRYAHQAQERTARELAQAKELARVQRQVAARAAAQQRLSIAQAALAAKASVATRLGLPADSAASETATVATTATSATTTTSALAARSNRRRSAAAVAVAQQPETAISAAATEENLATDVVPVASRRVGPRPANLSAEARASSRPQPESRRGKDEKTEVLAPLYTIRPGDNLTKLAREQGVSIAQIKAWNKLTTENVVAGQQLRLSAPADATALPVAAATQAAPVRRARPEAAAPKLETHTVQPGDTLFSIARHFGLSLEELKRLNHLASDQVKLKPGQKLVVHG